ncbi:flippase [Faecalicatena sp. AGMB00832]|uniref:Flippase n=1 Tax=Faecalicatena faecalis TaxID=2726362 RepID=A0ABS6D663_9FIRM|nr:flippase [Faecalicatena faecalis]
MKVNSVKFNFIMNFILTASSIIFPLITFPYISRTLLAAGSGAVSSAASVLSYFAMFASLGIPTYGIRACARVRDDREELSRTVQELMIVNTVTTVLTYAVFLVLLAVVPKFAAEKELLMINSVSLILNVIGVSWLYSALEEYGYIASRTLIFKVISIIFMFLMVKSPDDYIIYGAISVFAGSGSYVLNFLRLRRYVDFKKTQQYHFKEHLKPIMIFFATSAGISVYTNLDTVMLWMMKTNVDVGYYSAGIKVKTVLSTLITSLGTVLLPRLSYYAEKGNKDEFYKIIAKACNFVVLLGAGVTVYFWMYAKESILLLAGADFYGAIAPMKYLMPTVLLIGLSNVTGIQVLTPTGRESKVLYSILAGAVTDFVLNLVLIPYIAADGAAIATTVAELVVLLVQCIYLKDTLPKIVKDISIRKVFVALILAMAGGGLIRWLDIKSLFLNLLISAVVFFGIYGGMLMLQKESFVCGTLENSIQMIRNKLNRR